jgi:hypothetical protein
MKLLPPFARTTLRLLQRPIAGAEADALRVRCEAMEAQFGSRAAPTEIDGAAFVESRLAASTSSGGAAARQAFGRANERVLAWVSTDAPVTLGTVRALNAALRGSEGEASFRRTPTTLDGHTCPGPDVIQPLLAPLLDAVAARSQVIHPIAGAGLLYQWLVTVHPFDDANGRTARLAVDHHLGLAGLPPASIEASGVDHVAVRPENEQFVTATFACEVVLRGLEKSEHLLWPT